MRFFDRYERFYSTSRVGAWPNRLNARHDAIIQHNEEQIRGRHVLDIASHDGRWSFAALQAGCAHVIGIEARPHLVSEAEQTFACYGVSPDRYKFVRGDVFDVMAHEIFEVQTVLLLGFYYHLHRHVDLAALVANTGATTVILDTMIIPEGFAPGPLIQLFEEPTNNDATAIGPSNTMIVGRPSREAIKMIFGQFGFDLREFDWTARINDSTALHDYHAGTRSTFVLTR